MRTALLQLGQTIITFDTAMLCQGDVAVYLARVAGSLAGFGVVASEVKTLANQTAEINVTIDVRDTDHLAQMMTKIGQFGDVISIVRVFGRALTK